MKDYLDDSWEPKGGKWRKLLVALAILYFLSIIIYAIGITSRKMSFFTRIAGHDTYETGGALALRFSVIGMQEMAPVRNFGVKLELFDGGSGETHTLFEGDSGRETYLDARGDLPKLDPGNYMARVTTKYGEYEPEINEFTITLTGKPSPRTVDLQVLDERYTKPAWPILAISLKPPVELRLIPNNGRFVQSINNTILVVAEYINSHLPAGGVTVRVSRSGNIIAEVTTDEFGYAEFPYYCHIPGGQFVEVELSDRSGGKFSGKTELRLPGSQVAISPFKFLWPKGEAVRFKLETLMPGCWHIDAFLHGNWLLSTKEKIRGKAPQLVGLKLPDNTVGPVYIQVAADFNQPNISYDAFFAFVYDPKDTEIDHEDPRFRNVNLNDPKIEDLRLEKPFKSLWQFADKSRQLDRSLVEKWQRKINALSLKKLPYSPRALAREILKAVPKDYILPTELINTRENRISAFKGDLNEDRGNVLLLLGISGVVVVMLIVFRIMAEMRSREEDDILIEIGTKHVGAWIIFLFSVIAAYTMILYLIANLDWRMGI